MDETGVKLLSLMFIDGETICVSPNKYGYHSIPLENALNGQVTLLSPDQSRSIEYCDSSELLFVALNPIYGQRQDINCKTYRNFLVEMDTGTIKEQIDHINSLGLPFSAAVFSGNKSCHFLISLDQDLPNEKVYRTFGEWILNIIPLADPNCKNPSRSIRVPGAIRDNGNRQRLLKFNGKVKLTDLSAWLAKYKSLKPKGRTVKPVSDSPSLDNVAPWVGKALIEGIDRSRGRNKVWFTIACEFAIAGFDFDDTLNKLLPYFHEERDFKEKEWQAAIKSGCKYILENRKRNA